MFAACRVIKDRRIDQRVYFDAGIDRLHRMMPKHIIACARRDCVDILEYAARLPAGRGPAVDSTGNVADEETLIKIAPRGHHVGEREPIPVKAENIAPLAIINEAKIGRPKVGPPYTNA